MPDYDLVVIGSGPAGQRAAIQGAKSGKRVALIERREVIGGVCINTGTIPSKTMREAVLHLSGYNYQNIYGVSYRVKEKITMADLAFRVQHVIKTEIDVTQAQLSRNGIEVITGVASFKTPTTIQVAGVARNDGCKWRDRHHRDRHQTSVSPLKFLSTAAPSSTATRSWKCPRSKDADRCGRRCDRR